MSDTKDGGPAFPVHTGNIETRAGLFPVVGGGMSLRDWFAGQALILTGKGYQPNRECAEEAYEWADFLLVARTKGEEK